MAVTLRQIRRAECALGEALSALRSIVLQTAEFLLFIYGLLSLLLRLLRH
jgi:hypothetical protein